MITKFTPPSPPVNGAPQIIERPDGYYWQDMLTKEIFGPFPTRSAAEQDIETQTAAESYEEGETIVEAEDEIGLSDWVDPETGELAEDHTPHLSEE